MSALRAEGYELGRLLECAGMARSSYYYALSHPARPTRPELRDAVAEIFSRTANGCGHRQVAMCLRAELGARIAYKTVLKMMREMGVRCGIRRETDYHRYNSYRGVVGETFENVIGRDFAADGPWQKMGTDVTEFKQPWGKAYFAPVYDFGSKEIVAWSTSTSPDMAQQAELLDRLHRADLVVDQLAGQQDRVLGQRFAQPLGRDVAGLVGREEYHIKAAVRELLCGVDGRGVLDLGHDDAALFVAVEMRRTVQADIRALRAAGGEIDFLGQAAERRGNRFAAVLEQM